MSLPTIEAVAELLGQLGDEYEHSLPVVRLSLEDGRTLDVFRAERVREHPVVWRVRGFIGDIRPYEFVALILGTIDGRVILTRGPGENGEGSTVGWSGMESQPVVGASRSSRKLSDLADAIARRVRSRFAPP